MMEISVPPSVKSCNEDGMDGAIENTRSVGPCAGDAHTTSALSWTWAFWDGGQQSSTGKKDSGGHSGKEVRRGNVSGGTALAVWPRPGLWGPAVMKS